MLQKFPGVFGLIAFILVKNTQYNQRPGDQLAGTIVVDKIEMVQTPEFDFEENRTI